MKNYLVAEADLYDNYRDFTSGRVMFCYKCGAALMSDASRFCGRCGAQQPQHTSNSKSNSAAEPRTLASGMAYVERNLVSSEEIVFSTRKHWVVLLRPILIAGLLSMLALAASTQESEAVKSVSLWLLLLAVVILIVRFLRWRATEIALTNKRLIRKSGILSRRSEEIMVNRVESIFVEQGLLGRMLNYGTLILRGTGSSFEPLVDIPEPMELRKCILDQVSHELAQSTYR